MDAPPLLSQAQVAHARAQYRSLPRVDQDVAEVLVRFSALQAAIRPFTHNNGATELLITIAGPLPFVFRGVQYVVPIMLVIPYAYPAVLPLCFVVPTREMAITEAHQHVDASGQFRLGGVRWSADQSLTVLIYTLLAVCEQHPPVYSRPPALTEEEVRVSLLKKAERKVAARVLELQREAAQGIDEEVAEQSELEKNAQIIRETQQVVAARRERLQYLCGQADAAEGELQRWLDVHGPLAEMGDVDRLVVGLDARSQQYLWAHSEAAAIEDLLYTLGRAFRRGAMDRETYFKEVKEWARRQFEARATVRAIEAREQRPARPAEPGREQRSSSSVGLVMIEDYSPAPS